MSTGRGSNPIPNPRPGKFYGGASLRHQLQRNFLDHTFQSYAVKGVSWTQRVLTKDKGAALPQGVTSKSRRQKIQLHSFFVFDSQI